MFVGPQITSVAFSAHVGRQQCLQAVVSCSEDGGALNNWAGVVGEVGEWAGRDCVGGRR